MSLAHLSTHKSHPQGRICGPLGPKFSLRSHPPGGIWGPLRPLILTQISLSGRDFGVLEDHKSLLNSLLWRELVVTATPDSLHREVLTRLAHTFYHTNLSTGRSACSSRTPFTTQISSSGRESGVSPATDSHLNSLPWRDSGVSPTSKSLHRKVCAPLARTSPHSSPPTNLPPGTTFRGPPHLTPLRGVVVTPARHTALRPLLGVLGCDTTCHLFFRVCAQTVKN